MAKDRLQASRFEQKYIIDEALAVQVRDFVRSYMELDENGATYESGVGQPNFSYPVHSLYLDSDDLKLYWSTINGDKNRFKLRLRFYNNNPNTPVFFEIKRRMNNCIVKERGGVRRDAVDWLLGGHLPDPGHLVSRDPRQLSVLQRFCQLLHQYHAKPKVHISYLREAYMPHDDNTARVTMDREVLSEPEMTSRLSTRLERPISVWGKDVVLELKFTNRFPDWFRELVRVFNLRQCGAAKYVDGVALLGEYRLDPRRARPFIEERAAEPVNGEKHPAPPAMEAILLPKLLQ